MNVSQMSIHIDPRIVVWDGVGVRGVAVRGGGIAAAVLGRIFCGGGIPGGGWAARDGVDGRGVAAVGAATTTWAGRV